jgi:GNAT superfamily N-acetyltransferase
LQRKNSDSLGFLPRTAFEEGIAAGQIFLGILNGDPCGYIFCGSGYQGILRRWQLAIQYDARRRLYATKLIEAADAYGESLGCTKSIVRCASDLPDANAFWESVGYYLVGTAPAGEFRAHRRQINIYEKQLNPPWVATSWVIGRPRRPRLYSSNAEKQRAYRKRLRYRNCVAARTVAETLPLLAGVTETVSPVTETVPPKVKP